MSIQVTMTLDSGSFLEKKGSFCEIGYFQCEDGVSDIKIFIDGEEVGGLPSPFKLCEAADKKCEIEVVHKDENGQAKTDGVRTSRTFHSQLLHMEHLYGKGNHQPVERTNFDCILRFDTGHFRASNIKKRDFKEHKKQPDGSFKHDPSDKPTTVQPVSHNVVVHFTLEDREVFVLARDGAELWTSKGKVINERLEIEIAADNSTAEKFYRKALKNAARQSYFLPNQGDPPPSCPSPPCPEFP